MRILRAKDVLSLDGAGACEAPFTGGSLWKVRAMVVLPEQGAGTEERAWDLCSIAPLI
jgi:hypothetical protein